MVLLGGLEVLAAGYLIHKHNKNKKERARLDEEAAALEEASYPIFPNDRPPRRHTHSHHSEERPGRKYKQDHEYASETEEERKERRRRRREKREDAMGAGVGRTNSAPPPQKMMGVGMAMGNASQNVVAPGVVAGWPAHWEQSQQPPRMSTPQPMSPPMNHGQNGFPQDVKYGFVPEIPHEELPPYTEHRRDERRSREARHGERLEVRGRRERRSVSPNLGVREDEYSRSPARVRFSTEDVVVGSRPPRYKA